MGADAACDINNKDIALPSLARQVLMHNGGGVFALCATPAGGQFCPVKSCGNPSPYR
jgi:hypothetical protein